LTSIIITQHALILVFIPIPIVYFLLTTCFSIHRNPITTTSIYFLNAIYLYSSII